MITFKTPVFLYLLYLLPIIGWLSYKSINSKRDISFPTFAFFPKKNVLIKKNTIYYALFILLNLFLYASLVLALARPQIHKKVFKKKEGIPIVIAIDLSRSMMAEDFQPKNRLEVAKEEAKKFIDKRENDQIGIVVFANYAVTKIPLTFEHEIIKKVLLLLRVGEIDGDGTAIGMAIATAVNRLKDAKAKSKVIILLTDGINNSGQISPLNAAEMAKDESIKIYTIGIGKSGKVPFPKLDPVFGKSYSYIEVDIDEEVLKKISEITGGVYFHAKDKESLENIYNEIDKLEKSELKSRDLLRQIEIYGIFLLIALLLFLVIIVYEYKIFTTIP